MPRSSSPRPRRFCGQRPAGADPRPRVADQHHSGGRDRVHRRRHRRPGPHRRGRAQLPELHPADRGDVHGRARARPGVQRHALDHRPGHGRGAGRQLPAALGQHQHQRRGHRGSRDAGTHPDPVRAAHRRRAGRVLPRTGDGAAGVSLTQWRPRSSGRSATLPARSTRTAGWAASPDSGSLRWTGRPRQATIRAPSDSPRRQRSRRGRPHIRRQRGRGNVPGERQQSDRQRHPARVPHAAQPGLVRAGVGPRFDRRRQSATTRSR